MNKLSAKQDQILTFIKAVKKDRGYPPSVREICAAVDLKSTSTVHSHLNKLEELGYIRRDPTKPRAIEIIDDMADWINNHVQAIPLVGHVTAGEPILAVENIEAYFPVSTNLVRDHEVYMLRVSGESMINAGILDKDCIIIRQQHTANNGDIVVARSEDGVTVKRFFKEKDRIRLQPENDTMSPLYYTEIELVGKVIGVYREM